MRKSFALFILAFTTVSFPACEHQEEFTSVDDSLYTDGANYALEQADVTLEIIKPS